MSTSTRPRPVLDVSLILLTRSSGEVQVGWDPDRAVLIAPPAGVAPRSLAGLLNRADGSRSHAELAAAAAEVGIDSVEFDALLGSLGDAGMLSWRPAPGLTVADAVHVHGRGPLSDAIVDALGLTGIRLTRSTGHLRVPREWPTPPAVVVLADELVADPCLTSALVGSRIAHLSVCLRDGTGMVGPLVLPGRTSCLRCAHLHRADHDAEWPTLAAQLLGRAGCGSAAAVRATAGFALGQVEHLLRGPVAGEAPPQTLNATIEVDPHRVELRRRAWTAHPRCGCGAYQ